MLLSLWSLVNKDHMVHGMPGSPWGERGRDSWGGDRSVEFSRRRKGRTFFFSLHSLVLVTENVFFFFSLSLQLMITQLTLNSVKERKWKKITQSCLTLCHPMDCSLPGSSIQGIFPGKNIGVGCHFLLQGIFPTQESNPSLLHCRQMIDQLRYEGSLYNLEYRV